MLSLKAELLFDAQAELGEGLQLSPNGNMTWVDIERGEVHGIAAGATHCLHKMPHPVSKVLPWAHGYLVFGTEHVIGFNPLHQEILRFAVNPRDSNLRFSDGAVLPDGTVAVGIMDLGLAPKRGSLVRILHDWTIEPVLEGATIPNGIGLGPSRDELIWIDSPTQELTRFRFDAAGQLVRSGTRAVIGRKLGVPDGLCVDSDGGCWVALWGGGKVIRINQSGEIDCEISVGCSNVTSCGFDQNDNLLITTATATLSAGDAILPGAGGIWVVPAELHLRHGLVPLQATLSALDKTGVFNSSSASKPEISKQLRKG
jgi:sugar lactone lactonase YvrE